MITIKVKRTYQVDADLGTYMDGVRDKSGLVNELLRKYVEGKKKRR